MAMATARATVVGASKGWLMKHELLKAKHGDVEAHRAVCSCGLVLVGVGRKDAAHSIKTHAYRKNEAARHAR